MGKRGLREEFSRDYKKHYEVALFRERGFKRQKCKKCGTYFWCISESETCGDSSCEPYSFIKKDWKRGDYIGMWKKFSDFFEKNGHAPIGRYPVIARWRPDLYFTIASIVDFMRLEQGKVVWEYPENPLVVPQVCLRFPDIPNVGITGRHHTSFIMAGQHAFLDGNKKAYWKDECIGLNFRFLTEVLGIPDGELKYKEDVWSMPDMSSFGPCIETFCRGVELVNSVFTEYTKGPDGIRELEMKVIDVGWGFERLVWFSSGAPTSYDANLGYAVEWMVEKAGIEYDRDLHFRYSGVAGSIDVDENADVGEMRKRAAEIVGVPVGELDSELGAVEAVYAIADHTKTIVFALADGALPSNVGGGYNLRVVLRRAQHFIDRHQFPFTLEDVARLHIEYLKEMFPELEQVRDEIGGILELEIKRYRSTVENAKGRVEALAKKGSISEEALVQEYESNGVTPEIIAQVARERGIRVSVPENFYSLLTQRHIFSAGGQEEERKFSPEGLVRTVPLYYDGAVECDAKIISIQGNAVVLDRTCFYPEGGGQKYDTGAIDGTVVSGTYVYEGVIFHIAGDDSGFRVGQKVHCKIDAERRMALVRHHTATHILGGVCRKVLGDHVWQAGAHKDVDKATLDITHYRRLSADEIRMIENEANGIVFAGIKVDIREYDRGEAEGKYGFVLYQGGGSPGKKVRIVSVEGVDVEACGGLHVENTSEIGLIKIVRAERIQDGVVRLTYCAGKAALEYVRHIEGVVLESAGVFSVGMDDLPKTCERFFSEWKERGKALEKIEDAFATEMARTVEGISEVDCSRGVLVKIAGLIAMPDSSRWAVVINKDGFVAAAAGGKSGKNAKVELEKVLREKGGKGGGNERVAMGRLK